MNIMELLKKHEEERKKAIPSRVFYNHLCAIQKHILSNTDRYNLRRVDYYNHLVLRNANFNLESCRKLLWNSWSTEYAMSLTSLVNNKDYYRFAMHWVFPQAYYSVYLAMTAFHETQGIANEIHEKSIKIFGNSIKDGHYPESIGFYATGMHEDFSYMRLPNATQLPSSFTGLSHINSLEDAQAQIISFLKSTRKINAENKRERLKDANDKKFHNSFGKFKVKFSKADWDKIYISIPETTILNILYRLRIKANYQDVETFINADINFREFNNFLSEIVSYLNYVHEAYIFKVIGQVDYEHILNGFPNHLNSETAVKRYNCFINPPSAGSIPVMAA